MRTSLRLVIFKKRMSKSAFAWRTGANAQPAYRLRDDEMERASSHLLILGLLERWDFAVLLLS